MHPGWHGSRPELRMQNPANAMFDLRGSADPHSGNCDVVNDLVECQECSRIRCRRFAQSQCAVIGGVLPSTCELFASHVHSRMKPVNSLGDFTQQIPQAVAMVDVSQLMQNAMTLQ